MNPFVLSFFYSIIFATYCFISSSIILKKREKNVKNIIVAFIPFLIMYYSVLCLLDSVFSTFFSGLFAFLFIKIIFKENLFISLFISIVIHIIKTIFKVFILLFLNNDDFRLINTYKTFDINAFYINIVSILFALICIIVFIKAIRNLFKRISSLNNRAIILIGIIYIDFIIVILFEPPTHMLTLQLFTDFVIIFFVTAVGIFNISSEMKMEDLTNHYKEIFEYSRMNGKLLSNYKMQVHENKNKLLIIRGMLDDSKEDVKKYINEVLKEIEENNSNYWVTELRYIPLAGVRNFINYKLTKLKELGAEIEIFVSSELENLDISNFTNKEYNQLSTILGVVLDNMIDSIRETEEKLVSINIYLEDNEIQAEFVNTFSGNIDLSRLNEIGYTTKGEQHGVGLPLVAKITKMNDRFECNPKILDNFFIQHLTVKICKKNNIQKISKK